MSNEDFERKAEFIIEQQAQFTSRIGQLEDLVTRFARATHERFHITDKRADEMDERITALINSQIHTEENLKKTDEQQKKTDEQLRNLIAVVDRYFSEGRNGEVPG